MDDQKIALCVEAICNKGCQMVRQDIRLLEAGDTIPEVDMLDGDECRLVLQELKSIMAVYGDSCRIP
jgi:hypothetical protein